MSTMNIIHTNQHLQCEENYFRESHTPRYSLFECHDHFQNYLQSKGGNYKPDPAFCEHILLMMQNGEYPFCREKLLVIERIFFMKHGVQHFASSLVRNVSQSIFLQNQSHKMGFTIEMERKLQPANEVPSLVDICYKVLLKNGYPQAFINAL